MTTGEVSAGVLVWRSGEGGPEVLLVHPGGPFWRGKETAAWSIPKGLAEPGEDLLAAALREFEEEVGLAIGGDLTPLPPHRLPGGKRLHIWLAKADLDLTGFRSNLFEMAWPPRSGRMQSFPEADQAAYASAEVARMRIHKGQRPVLEEALARIGESYSGSSRS